jgi:hypothetical protein
MDIVPCIPADENRKILLLESMRRFGIDEFVASSASQHTVSITDDRHQGYRILCNDWDISNPEGYAQWFEYRMSPSRMQVFMEKAQVDDVPIFKRKTPLQRVVQLLKRHRDQMFKGNEDVKPISIIITTLAARAYDGEQDIVSSLDNILVNMDGLINRTSPRVPNPVDPEEDFADRWAMPKYRHLNLEQNFWYWLKQVQTDFEHIITTTDTQFITEQVDQKFSLKLNKVELAKQLGISTATVNIITPKKHSITESAKPWWTNR